MVILSRALFAFSLHTIPTGLRRNSRSCAMKPSQVPKVTSYKTEKLLLRSDLEKVKFGNYWPFLKHDTPDASFHTPNLLPGLSCFYITLTQYSIFFPD